MSWEQTSSSHSLRTRSVSGGSGSGDQGHRFELIHIRHWCGAVSQAQPSPQNLKGQGLWDLSVLIAQRIKVEENEETM